VRRSIGRAALAGEAALALTAASVAARVAGSSRTTRLLGLPAAPPEPDSGLPPAPAVRQVGNAVERVARILPWHPVCLPQAIATRAMLRRRGVACISHLGVYGSSPVTAHAWVTVGATVVQGGPVGHVKELAVFR
jgi:hypothetical protein